MEEKGTSFNLLSAKQDVFPTYTYEDWVQEVEKSLKGRTISSLYQSSYEGIPIRPLYTKSDKLHPILKHELGWKITLATHGSSPEHVNANLRQALKWGQDTISITIDPQWKLEDLNKLFQDIQLSEYPLFIHSGELAVPFYMMFQEWSKQNSINLGTLSGFIGSDPFCGFLKNGWNEAEANKYYETWSKCVQNTTEELPQMKSILVDGMIYEKTGGNSVQQLAYTFAAAVEHIERLKAVGIPPHVSMGKMIFGYSIGTQFYIEISKLRAARYLWRKLQEAYQVDSIEPMTIYAETGYINKSTIEESTNLLRSGGEALAAVIGQVDYLQIVPYDALNDRLSAYSQRVSLNIHHLLREESKLSYVSDPASGSYYIESLTNELIEKAWQEFLRIDREGGLFSKVIKGDVQKDLNEIKEKRLKSFEQRDTILIGANRYVDKSSTRNRLLAETEQPYRIKQLSFNEIYEAIQSGSSLCDFLELIVQDTNIVPILKPFRLTERLERMRLELAQIQVQAGLISIGDLSVTKKITDYASDFFAAGGIEVYTSNSITTTEEVKEFIDQTNYPIYCLCGELSEAINLVELSEQYSNKIWIGVPSDQTNVQSIFFAAIDKGTNQVEFFSQLLKHLGGDRDEA